MEDPFSALLKSLQSVFHLEAMRNGKYTYPEVQRLKESIDNYNPKAKNTFIELLTAIRISLPYIEKWRISFASIKKPMDELAKLYQMPSIDWNVVLSHPKVSPRFQFKALSPSNQEDNLSAWLAAKTGKPFTQMHHSEVTQALVKHHRDHQIGFSDKLSAHLKKYPDFLFQLIMDSHKNFTKICNTRLILYLTDQQIAKAIIKHIPSFVHKRTDPFEQVEQLVHTLNDILSSGRSVSTLLRNSEARPILYNSIFFQIYQTEGYKKRETQSTPLPASNTEGAKPDF